MPQSQGASRMRDFGVNREMDAAKRKRQLRPRFQGTPGNSGSGSSSGGSPRCDTSQVRFQSGPVSPRRRCWFPASPASDFATSQPSHPNFLQCPDTGPRALVRPCLCPTKPLRVLLCPLHLPSPPSWDPHRRVMVQSGCTAHRMHVEPEMGPVSRAPPGPPPSAPV